MTLYMLSIYFFTSLRAYWSKSSEARLTIGRPKFSARACASRSSAEGWSALATTKDCCFAASSLIRSSIVVAVPAAFGTTIKLFSIDLAPMWQYTLSEHFHRHRWRGTFDVLGPAVA